MSTPGDDDFLSRWSRRKAAARTGEVAEEPRATVPAAKPPHGATAVGPPTAAPAPLPPVESLTAESDFTPFMKPEVDEGVKRQALKTLFSDPRFNVMDGMDVYIDDYSKPDPLPESWLGQLNQLARLGHYQETPAPAKEEAVAQEPEPASARQELPEPKDPERREDIPPESASESDTSVVGRREPGI